MKNRIPKDNPNAKREKINGSESINQQKKMKKRNMMRLGGGGLSLEAFANAKSKSNDYNPALIKKQREFYKNAKYVRKYKKSVKQLSHQNDPSSSIRYPADDNEAGEAGKVNQIKKKSKKIGAFSLRELYERKHGEDEREKVNREATIQAKKDEREKAESRRKALREKMFKKTKSGQPVMKYRIEHLLESIQGSMTMKHGQTDTNTTQHGHVDAPNPKKIAPRHCI